MKKSSDNNGWQDGETAPKTGEQFLADIGMPWAVMAFYNDVQEEFVYAEMECSLFDGKPDCYFITEYEKPKNIKRWRPLPKL